MTAPETPVSGNKRPRDTDSDLYQDISLDYDEDKAAPDHSVKRAKDASYEQEVSHP